MVAGGLVKHNLVALPIATGIWLLMRDRRLFATWCAAGISFAGAAVAALLWLFGSAMIGEILAFSRTYRWDYFAAGVSRLAFLLPAIIVSAVALRERPRDARWSRSMPASGCCLARCSSSARGSGSTRNMTR